MCQAEKWREQKSRVSNSKKHNDTSRNNCLCWRQRRPRHARPREEGRGLELTLTELEQSARMSSSAPAGAPPRLRRIKQRSHRVRVGPRRSGRFPQRVPAHTEEQQQCLVQQCTMGRYTGVALSALLSTTATFAWSPAGSLWSGRGSRAAAADAATAGGGRKSRWTCRGRMSRSRQGTSLPAQVRRSKCIALVKLVFSWIILQLSYMFPRTPTASF